MDRDSHEPTKRYLMIELSCDETQCNPCTYPNCQRYVRLQPKSKKFAGTIKPIVAKPLEINEPVEKKLEEQHKEELKYPHHVNRYILAELSCSNAKCNPCTYPNCQRFAKPKNPKLHAKGPMAKTVELKPDKQVKEAINQKK